MLDFIQLMSSETSAQAIDPAISSDAQDTDLNESSFIMLMAQMLINGEQEDTPDLADKQDMKQETKQDEHLQSDGIEDNQFAYENQAMAWINADGFLPPSESAVDADFQTELLPVQTNSAQITAKTVASDAADKILSDEAGSDLAEIPMDAETMKKGLKISTDSKAIDANRLRFQQIDDYQEHSDFSQNLKTPLEPGSKVDLNSLTAMADIKTNAPMTKGTDHAMIANAQVMSTNLQANNLSNTAIAPQTQMTHLTIPADVSDSSWGDQFNQHIVWLGQQTIKSAQIKLNPPELGPLDITIKMDKQSADLSIHSHSLQVREALDQALPRLREMMSAQGLTLGEVNIDSRSKNQEQSSQQQADNLPQFESGGEPLAETTTIVRRAVKGLIDYFA